MREECTDASPPGNARPHIRMSWRSHPAEAASHTNSCEFALTSGGAPFAVHMLRRCRSPLGRPTPPGERPGGTAPRQVRGALSFRCVGSSVLRLTENEKGTPEPVRCARREPKNRKTEKP